MCTIGVVMDQSNIVTFKQCDLIPTVNFRLPETRRGTRDVEAYIALSRGEGEGHMWSGVNSNGVAFVAADAYTTSSLYNVTPEQTEALFSAYEDSVRGCSSPREAAARLSKFYLAGFPAPDIALYSGWEDSPSGRIPVAIFLEYMPNPSNQSPVRQIVRHEGYFVSTNHFRLQPESITYPSNHSTYLRLNRAETILQSSPNKDGVLELLRDQYYGPTELSICRETDYQGQEFHTQATSVFTVGGSIECEYQINGNPKDNPLRRYAREEAMV